MSLKNLSLCAPLLLFLTLGLACGGGGGGGEGNSTRPNSSPAQTSSGLRTKIQPSALFNILPGTTFSVQKLSSTPTYLLKEASLSGDDFQTFEMEFSFDENYRFIVNRYGAPFLQTILMGSQIEKASESGILNIGEINAITTFFSESIGTSTGLNKANTTSRKKSELDIRTTIAQYFGINASFNFAELSFDNINSGRLSPREGFDSIANRINLLLFYIGNLSDLTTEPSAAQKAALNNLFSGLMNENLSISEMSALLSSTDLPKPSDNGADIISRMITQGYAIQTSNSLPLESIRNIYVDPVANLQFLQQAISIATSQLSGTMSGYQIENIQLNLKAADGTLVQSVSTLSNGDYKLKGLEAGSYEVTPESPGQIFRPASFKVEVGTNQRLKGYDFTNFLYVAGSQDVPTPDQVIKGVSYTDNQGNPQQGSFSVLTPDPSKVESNTFYGDETGIALAGNLIVPSADSVLQGVSFGPAGQLTGNASTVVVMRQAPTGQASTSRFRVSYY